MKFTFSHIAFASAFLATACAAQESRTADPVPVTQAASQPAVVQEVAEEVAEVAAEAIAEVAAQEVAVMAAQEVAQKAAQEVAQKAAQEVVVTPATPAVVQAPVVPAAKTPAAAAKAPVAERTGARLWTDAEQLQKVEAAINQPLSVNGVDITPAQVRTQLVRTVGRSVVDSRMLDLLIAAEIEMRVKGGEAAEKFVLSEEEITTSIDLAVSQITAQYPNESLADVLAANDLDLESLSSRMTQTKRFDRVFLPENPAEWPASSAELLGAALGADAIEKMTEQYLTRVDAEGNVAPAAADQGMFRGIMRNVVIQGLMETAKIETAADGLPDGVVQRVNGQETLTSEVYAEVAKTIHPEEVFRTRLYLARLEATRQALQAEGAWLTDEEFAPLYAAEEAVGADSPFNIKMVTLSLKRYPTMDVYKTIFRGVKSYEKMLGENLSEEALAEWLPRAGRMLGLGDVDCEILLVSAFDYPRNDWKDGGWAEAEATAMDIAEQLNESGGEKWDDLIEAHSEFFDPPTQQGAMAPASSEQKNKGRFGAIHRNRLMQQLNESEYTAFIDGYLITDMVYYDQEVGTIDGPFLGKFGYYFTRVDGRPSPKKQVALTDPTMRSMVLQDYLMTNFIGFANDALTNAEVVGL
jgi:hypothetical protein